MAGALGTLRPLQSAVRSLSGVTTQCARTFADYTLDAVAKRLSEIPEITVSPGQAYKGDLRSTSALGTGDGLTSHTSKWFDGPGKSPMDYCREAEPIKVSGAVVASYGSENTALGCPVEYINLRGTSREKPAVCKYTGNKYYSDNWRQHH